MTLTLLLFVSCFVEIRVLQSPLQSTTCDFTSLSMDSFLNTAELGENWDDDSSPIMNNPMLSTPGPTYTTTQSIVVPMAMPMIDRQLKKFNGFMHEDGAKFLEEFRSYMTLSGIEQSSPRAVAAFHLQLQGPALIWFNSLPTVQKTAWATVEEQFRQEFCNIANNPSFVAEEATFNHLSIKPGQPIEEFASVVQEKGRRLGKSDRDMTFKFIDGLPPQLAFFIRAGRVLTLRDALHSAKLGEAHGYRSHTTTTTTTTCTPTQDQVQILSQRVQALEVNSVAPKTSNQTTNKPSRKSGKPKITCFKCSGPGHVKRSCNWNGDRDSQPETCCQLCDQMGHAASFCVKLPRKHPKQLKENCQLCSSDTHIAKDCPQLNPSGLGSPRGSQA